MRALGVGVLFTAVVLGTGDLSPTQAAETPAPEVAEADPTPTPSAQAEAPLDNSGTLPDAVTPFSSAQTAAAATPPYGTSKPITVETNFARPKRSISSSSNSDFSQLNDLERMVRGSYIDPRTGAKRSSSVIKGNYVLLSISRMENARSGLEKELVRAAKAGVMVRVIHGKASQSKESRALQKSLNATKTGKFKICAKGKSLACLSNLNGAIMHSKILIVKDTFDRSKNNALGAVWSGSANLGGPSGERTWNNGWTVYNDKKLFVQFKQAWSDMWAERNIGNDYLKYVSKNSSKYGVTQTEARAAGYTASTASRGIFYSNLSNLTYYLTPILASPSNGRDPVLNLLNRVIPDERCKIYLQHNRFKYRRIAVAQKLADLASGGCQIEAVAFRDDLKVNRVAHCQQWLRICRPILDELRTASVRIPTSWAKPHDKTMLVDANLKPNRLNSEERLPEGGTWPSDGARAKVVQAGSASLTGSNLVVSDEVTTESTNPDVFEQYLQHWKAINRSYEFRGFSY